MIALCILGYVVSAIAAGYVAGAGTADFTERDDRVLVVLAASLTGPVGLTIAVAFAAALIGKRRADLAAARHRADLATLADVEREVRKLK